MTSNELWELYCQKIEECEETHRTEIEEGKLLERLFGHNKLLCHSKITKAMGRTIALNHKFSI